MTRPQQLRYNLAISTAAGYIHYITNSSPHTLTWWAQIYGVDDIKTWARDRCAALVVEANGIKAALGGDVEHSADTAGYAAALGRLGFRVD